MKNSVNGLLRQDRKAIVFVASLAIGVAFGLASAGLALVGALWAFVVLSLIVAVGTGSEAAENRRHISTAQVRSCFKIPKV